jgi:hypothetical protein
MCKFIYLFYNILQKWTQLELCIKISTHSTFYLICLQLKYSINFFTQLITIFLLFHKYNACNYIPHNAFFMNPIKGMEITFKFKQMYEKKIKNINPLNLFLHKFNLLFSFQTPQSFLNHTHIMVRINKMREWTQ